jgi:hypothetical protein
MLREYDCRFTIVFPDTVSTDKDGYFSIVESVGEGEAHKGLLLLESTVDRHGGYERSAFQIPLPMAEGAELRRSHVACAIVVESVVLFFGDSDAVGEVVMGFGAGVVGLAKGEHKSSFGWLGLLGDDSPVDRTRAEGRGVSACPCPI